MSIVISTAMVSGSLPNKFDKIAQAGFQHVDLFEKDFTGFSGTAQDVVDLAKNRGLVLRALDSVEAFEGMQGEERNRALFQLNQKLDLLNQLGIEQLQVRAGSNPNASDDEDVLLEDLKELADVASQKNIRIAYQALPWASTIKCVLKAQQFIRQIDDPHLGLCLDSMLLMGDGSRPAKYRDIDGKYVFQVSLFDLHRNKYHTPFSPMMKGMLPGQGHLNVAGFIRLLVNRGYQGVWSIGGTGQHSDLSMSSLAATDAYRALVNVLDEVRQSTPNANFDLPLLTDRVYASGIEFIEFAVDDDSQIEISNLLTSLRFRKERVHKTKAVELWRQGAINIVVNSDPVGFAGKAFQKYGPIVCDMGLRVKDAEGTVKRATSLGAPKFSQILGDNELDIPAINGIGGNVVHFIDEKSNLHHVWDIEFERAEGVSKVQPAGLRRVDHIAQTMQHHEMQSWLLYYLSTFEMEKTPIVDVADPAGVITSQAIQSPEGEVRLNLNGVIQNNTFAGNFLSGNVDAGVQHIALATDNIFETSAILAEADFPRLEISPNYYTAIMSEFALDPKLIDQMREGNILYSRRGDAEYFQIYSQPIFNGFFFEIVERRGGYAGYGAKNAPIRLAAQNEYQQSRDNVA